MTRTHVGWLIGIAALGMMLSLMATEVSQLADWHAALTPKFVGEMLEHLSVVIGAFVGGKLIPTAA